jgi:hypothetical protein
MSAPAASQMSDVESTDSRRERFVLSYAGIQVELDAKDERYRATHRAPGSPEIRAALANYQGGGGRVEDVRDEEEDVGEEGDGEGESSAEEGGDRPLDPAAVSMGVKRWINEVF